jgi:hypothetical protein
VDVVILHTDAEAVLLQKAVHTELQLANVFFYLVIVDTFKIKRGKKHITCLEINRLTWQNTVSFCCV